MYAPFEIVYKKSNRLQCSTITRKEYGLASLDNLCQEFFLFSLGNRVVLRNPKAKDESLRPTYPFVYLLKCIVFILYSEYTQTFLTHS